MARLSVQKKKRSRKNLMERAYGKEADFRNLDSTSDNYSDKIHDGMSWYRNNASSRDEKRWTLEYMVNNDFSTDDISYAKKIPVKEFANKGRFFRMIERGAVFDSDKISTLKTFIKYCLKEGRIKKESEPPRKSVQDYIKEQIGDYLSSLEVMYDTVSEKIMNKETVSFSMYNWLKSNKVKTIQSKKIAEYWIPRAEELMSAINKEDPQLVEGYSYYGRVALKKLHRTIQEWIGDCEKYHTEMKSTRKKRRKKK